MSIDYYGDGQHTLHVDQATIEDDNGTFTCLALNAAGRVQITADVFVHEKGNDRVRQYLHRSLRQLSLEVIDIPRKSPVLRSNPRPSAANESEPMPTDQHEEKVAPPPAVPRDDERERAKRLMEKFKTERSSQVLESK